MPGDLQGSIRQYCSCLQEWNASYEDYARSVGLSFTSLSILSTIYAHENCTQKMLCEICFLPKQTVNGVIRQFCKDGWISLIEMAKDRRNKAIRFTEQGRQTAGDILRRVQQKRAGRHAVSSPRRSNPRC
ncbi:MAG: helix-turn-helix domain-containing protein [Christensenellales bacterium]